MTPEQQDLAQQYIANEADVSTATSLLRAAMNHIAEKGDNFSTDPTRLGSAENLVRHYALHVLRVVKGNRSRAARILGFDRRTLYRRLSDWRKAGHEIPPTDYAGGRPRKTP